MYNNGDESLGFKDSEEMGMNNADGFHDQIGDTEQKDDEIEGELEFPDEEDFEEQEDLIIK